MFHRTAYISLPFLPPPAERSLLSGGDDDLSVFPLLLHHYYKSFPFLFLSFFLCFCPPLGNHRAFLTGSCVLTALIGQLSPPDTIAWIKGGVFVAQFWFLSSCAVLSTISTPKRKMCVCCACAFLSFFKYSFHFGNLTFRTLIHCLISSANHYDHKS